MRALAARGGAAVAPGAGQDPTLFGASATILSIAAVYCYFSGYIFSYYFYYQGFGLTLESLDLSPQFYFMRAYTALKSPGGIALLAVLTVTMVLYAGRKVRLSIVLMAMLGAFPALLAVSRTTARHEFLSRFCGPPGTIQFAFRDDLLKEPPPASQNSSVGTQAPKTTASGEAPAEKAVAQTPVPGPAGRLPGLSSNAKTPWALEALGDAGRLGLLLETKDRIIVFSIPNCYPLGRNGPRMAPPAHVYTLLRSDLKFTNVTP